ncbi:hypothetical protein AAMO2058_000650600 [Amorphochlora amoebiformis]
MHEPLLRNRKELTSLPALEPSVEKVRRKFAKSEGEELGCFCRMCACRPRCSGNIKTLITVIILFSVVSIAQLLGSYISNSLALLGDSISMGIDTLTFCFNLYAECSISKHKATIQLVASGVSLVALTIFTISVIIEAIDRLFYSDKHTVDPYIVLGFSFVGLCFDVIGFWAYYHWGHDPLDPVDVPLPDDDEDKGEKIKKLENFAANGHTIDTVEEGKERTTGANINILSALMHVASDALRSVTTLIEGLLILYTDLDSENTDAVASLIVSTIIVIGTTAAMFSWAQEVYKHMYGSDESAFCEIEKKELATPTAYLNGSKSGKAANGFNNHDFQKEMGPPLGHRLVGGGGHFASRPGQGGDPTFTGYQAMR